MWYVNRGGLVQGPYPLDSIVAGLKNGSLAGAVLCEQGSNAWLPPEGHPTIAQALGMVGGQQPPAHQGQPQGPAAGPPFAAQGVPPGQPPFAVAPQAPPSPGAKPKSNALLFAVLGGGALLLLLGAGTAVALYFFVLRGASPHLAQSVPKNASLYVEIPSVTHSIVALATMRALDTSKINEKQTTDDAVTGFASSFSISQDDARVVVVGVGAAAFAVTSSQHDGAALVALSSSGADKLLAAKRFTAQGTFGKAGKRYTLAANTPSAQAGKSSPVQQALDQLSTGPSDALVWFAKSNLLVIGGLPEVTEIAHVLEDGADSLEKSDAYVKAKQSFEAGADAIMFYDTHALSDMTDKDVQKLVKSYLRDFDPVTTSVRFVKAGVLIDTHGKLTGDSLPPDTLISAAKLTYPHQLPKETVGYMAFSTKTGMKGADARAAMIKHAQQTDPESAKALQDGLAEIEKAMGFTLDQIIDMVGDESAIAILLDKDFTYKAGDGFADEASKLGLVYELAVKDPGIAKQILAAIRTKISAPDFAKLATVKPDGDGFEIDPLTNDAFPLPNVRVKLENNKIVAVLASGPLAERALAALEQGKDTLKDDPAHESALGALPTDAHVYMWLDTGRLGTLLNTAAPGSAAAAKEMGVPIDAIRLTGPDRLTTAMALRYQGSNGAWTVDFDTLNVPGLAVLSGASQLDLPSASDVLP